MKIKLPRWLLYVLMSSFLLLLIAFLLYARHSGKPDSTVSPVEQIYFVDNISPAHEELIRRFNDANRNKIEVVPVNLPFAKFSTNERKQLLAKSLRSKSDRIDVFAIDQIWGARFARWAEPLNAYFTIHERSDCMEAALASCFYDDNLIAAPFYIDIGLMYYRADLVRKLPNADQIEAMLERSITWEEFIEIGRQNRQFDWFYAFPAKNFEGLICSFMEPLLTLDPAFFKDDSVNFNQPEALKSLQLLVDLVQTYQLTPQAVSRFDEVQTYYYAFDNDIPFFRGWPGLVRHYSESSFADKLAEIRVCSLPHLQGTQPGSVFGGWNLMVSRFSAKKREAVEFIKFLLRPDNQKLLHDISGYIPVNKRVYQDSSFFVQDPNLKTYHELMERGVHRPFLVNYTRISDILSLYIQKAIRNEISVEDALRFATRDINSHSMRID